MWSESKISASSFEEYEINITDNEKQKLIDNWEGSIENGQLVLSPSHQVISAIADAEKAKMKDDLEKAKSLDEIKSFLDKLLSN